MSVKNTIQTAVYTQLLTLELPVSFPGINFTPPASGFWLEVFFQPNTPIQNGIANDSSQIERGLFTVMVCTRPGAGVLPLQTKADEVAALFPKGLSLAGLIRISEHPYSLSPQFESDTMRIPVSISYSA